MVQKYKGVPKYLKHFWKVVFPVALAIETSLSEKNWKKLEKIYLDPNQVDRKSAYDLKKVKISKLSKWAEIEYPKPPDPPDYKNTSLVNFEPKLWKFVHEPSISIAPCKYQSSVTT